MAERTVLTVTQLNGYLKGIIENDPHLTRVYVSGEISNFTNHRSGHFYLTLKDEKCVIRAVMFRSSAAKVRFVPENGMKIIARGRIGVYEQSGQYQLYIDAMQPDGAGALSVAFEQLKKKLAARGMFDPAAKKPLPAMPRTIGIATSPTGAAVRDMISILGRRFPLARVILYPVLVQGGEAAADVGRAIRYFNRRKNVDLIIIGRGGGSLEELWAFNEEALAMDIFASQIPVISAVGHETDFTIADFVADLRAPTPSAAAELAVPNLIDLKRKIAADDAQIRLLITARLKHLRQRLLSQAQKRVLTSPEYLLDNRRMQTHSLTNRLDALMQRKLMRQKERFAASLAGLRAMNPLEVLARGYSIVTKEGKVIASSQEAAVGDVVNVRLSDGRLICQVQQRQGIEEEA